MTVKLEPPARVVVRAEVIHQAVSGELRCWGKPYSFDLSSDEQPYERRLTVSDKVVALELGWGQPSAQLLIVNEGMAEVLIRQFSSAEPFTKVSPGRMLLLHPTTPLCVWCQDGQSSKLLVVSIKE